MSLTLIVSQHPKIQEILRNCGVALDNIDLEEEALQRVFNRASELKRGIVDLVESLSLADQYINQQVESTWIYPPEYTGPKELKMQVEILVDLLPGLNPEPNWAWYEAYGKQEIPLWVEGVFAVPSEYAMQAVFHPGIQDRAAAYCASISLLLGKIAESRSFYNYQASQMDKSHLWRTDRTMEMLDSLWELQGKPDIILLPAQLGLRHRGRSVLRARECFVGKEFGAGSLEAAAILLTHPEKEFRLEQLHMDFGGDDFSSEADGQADEALFLDWDGGEVRFDAGYAGGADEVCGSVSCWLPPRNMFFVP